MRPDSNQRPPVYKTGALPSELLKRKHSQLDFHQQRPDQERHKLLVISSSAQGFAGPTEFNLLAFLHVQHLINTNVFGITNIYQEPATTKYMPSISTKKSPSPTGLNVPTET